MLFSPALVNVGGEHIVAAVAKLNGGGRLILTCWEARSTCRAREEEVPEFVTEAAGMARTRPMLEFILLWTSNGSLSFNKTFNLSIQYDDGQANVAVAARLRWVGTAVCVGKRRHSCQLQAERKQSMLCCCTWTGSRKSSPSGRGETEDVNWSNPTRARVQLNWHYQWLHSVFGEVPEVCHNSEKQVTNGELHSCKCKRSIYVRKHIGLYKSYVSIVIIVVAL